MTSGSLPAGLTQNSSTGAITGTPTQTANNVPVVVQVRDSGSPPQVASASLTLNVSPAAISMSLSPQRAGLTTGQKLSITATTNDYAGVTWSVSPSGGSLQPVKSTSGAAVSFTAPQTAGVYTLTAKSVTDPTQSRSIVIGVTDLPGVYTYHNDLARDGANAQEYALTPANVNSASFGKLFSCSVDGAIYTQPLWVANLTVSGTTHNVVFVGTQHDSLFAFDADASPCTKLWSVSLIDGAHGGTGNESPVPSSGSSALVGNGDGDLTPEVGITGTPVIHPTHSILYVISKSMSPGGTMFYQRLHAIDLATGTEKPGSPVAIAATFPGSSGGGVSVLFDPRNENQRAALALVNGTVYAAWGSHEDKGPFSGWLLGYQYDGMSLVGSSTLNAAPDSGEAGIWMSGAAPAADASGNLYVLTGNGAFDAGNTASPNRDYGDSFLQLSAALRVLQYFAPTDQLSDQSYNNDFGSGGATVLATLPPGSPVTHLAIAGGKDGNLYLLNLDSLGGLGDQHAWQELSVGTEGDLNADTPGVIFCAPALWNGHVYLGGALQPLAAFTFNTTTAKLSASGTASAPAGGYGYPGTTPSVSAMGTTNGIVWALDNSLYCTPASPGCGPAVLHAYDANNLSTELWNSSMSAADTAGNAVKFVVPTIANGKVYVATRGNNTGGALGSTSTAGELDVYGLKP